MENAILDLTDLAALLGRSLQTIKKDIGRNRLAVPPRLHIPGTRLLRWRQVDVDAWLASHVESRVDATGDRRQATSSIQSNPVHKPSTITYLWKQLK